ncbi:MAG: YkgJ family cysteine cluster protein [Candidatus Eremiobacteraeota bacterium]|nr:YkgJ family cysteine cluster protein [Candidatus Eremiobacteraeota bacterium]MCW5867911.1 YkgJ family cysteine cluster protein [Candidatus Eremiobacteraeota bacterium]
MRKRLQRLVESRGPAIRRDTPQNELVDTVYQRQYARTLEILQLPEEPALKAIRLCHSVHAASEQAWELGRQVFQPKIDCRAGCAFCCHMAVRVHILDAVGAAAPVLSRPLDYRLESRRREDLARVFQPCPLLVDGQCSIYAQRPVICRGYHSREVAMCEERFDRQDADLGIPMSLELYGLTGMPQMATLNILTELGIDCRPVVLGLAVSALQQNFEGMVADWLDGGRAFEEVTVVV